MKTTEPKLLWVDRGNWDHLLSLFIAGNQTFGYQEIKKFGHIVVGIYISPSTGISHPITIGNSMGQMVSLDASNRDQAFKVRICIEVDLRKSLPQHV